MRAEHYGRHPADLSNRLAMPLAPVVALFASPVLSAEPIVGRASVTDGDTVVIREIRLRLHGIEAPESGQFCQGAVKQD